MAKKAKSRTIPVRLISMALTGYYKTLIRPRAHRPLILGGWDEGLQWREKRRGDEKRREERPWIEREDVKSRCA
ncbi:hypothetical protein BCON_0130g00040 [Botryotinia convoluta]|uniref:Uncharacterized protein n=1 Tax=Botryotinia convoluta TaxID=54673 RepID=A0A4Z1I2W3_9HELO|nr:hypothetical protein BCON_0130g00040 [Botryotinia convoluta]